MRALARDAAASVGRHVATAAVGFISVPIIARALGAQLLGLWSLIGTVAFLLGLCDLGLNAAVLRVAAGDAPETAKRAVRYAQRATAVLLVPGAAACAIWLLRVAETIPEEGRGSARAAVLIAIGGGIVNALAQPWRSYAQGRGNILPLAHARTAGAVVQLVIMLCGLRFFGVSAVALGYSFGAIVDAALSFRASKDGVCGGGPIDAAERTELRRLGKAALVTNVSVALALRVDIVILQQVSSLETIAAYSIASRMVDQGFTLVKQLSAALVPRLGARARDINRTLALGTMVLGTLAAAPLAVVACIGRPLAVAWAGASIDVPVLGAAATWLGLASIVAATEEVAASRMTVGGNAHAVAVAIGVGSLTNVLVSVAGAYSVGPAAVAAATLLGNLVTALFIWRETMQAHGWTMDRLLSLFAPVVTAGLVAASCACGLRRAGLPAIPVAVVASLAGLAVAFLTMRAEIRTATQTVES